MESLGFLEIGIFIDSLGLELAYIELMTISKNIWTHWPSPLLYRFIKTLARFYWIMIAMPQLGYTDAHIQWPLARLYGSADPLARLYGLTVLKLAYMNPLTVRSSI